MYLKLWGSGLTRELGPREKVYYSIQPGVTSPGTYFLRTNSPHSCLIAFRAYHALLYDDRHVMCAECYNRSALSLDGKMIYNFPY